MKLPRRIFKFLSPFILKEHQAWLAHDELGKEKFEQEEFNNTEDEAITVDKDGCLVIHSTGGGQVYMPPKNHLVNGELMTAKLASLKGKDVMGWNGSDYVLFSVDDARKILEMPPEEQRKAAWLHYCERVGGSGGAGAKYFAGEAARLQIASPVISNSRISKPHLAL